MEIKAIGNIAQIPIYINKILNNNIYKTLKKNIFFN